MNQSQIIIKKPFFAKYTLTIESDFIAINVAMNSKTQIRWDFRVVDVKNDKMEIQLLLLDNILLESNNPLVKEVATLSQIFGRMYNELHLIIDHKGKILDVLNMDLILSKWIQTKTEMQKLVEKNPEIKNVILLNDSIFKDKNKLQAGIQGSEFFIVYFNEVYGHLVPGQQKNIFKNNLFNTVNIPWVYTLQSELTNSFLSNERIIILDAGPASPLTKDFYTQAYSQFSDKLDIYRLNASLTESGNYKIDMETGKLNEAVLIKKEIADEKVLFNKMTYTLINDDQVIRNTGSKSYQK